MNLFDGLQSFCANTGGQKKRLFCALSLSNLYVFAAFAENKPLILPPLEKNIAEKLVIILPGVNRNSDEYLSFAAELQRVNEGKLWIAIPKYSTTFPNPLEIDGVLKSAIESVKIAGFENANEENSFVVAHSLAGIFAQSTLANRKFSGLILMGSYLPQSMPFANSLATYNTPVLTLAGAKDGQTRVTRIAQEVLNLKKIRELENSTGEKTSTFKKPVVILPGINHAQMANGIATAEDLNPDLSYDEATRNLAQTASAFITANSTGQLETNKVVAKAFLENKILESQNIVQPYINALQRDNEICAEAQTWLLQNRSDVSELTQVKSSIEGNLFSFALSKPFIQTQSNAATVTTKSLIENTQNPFDVSTTPAARAQISCKMKSANAIAASLNLPTNLSDNISCAALNRLTYQTALDTVDLADRSRFLNRGIQLVFEADVKIGSGIQWLPAPLQWNSLGKETRRTALKSPLLYTEPGNGPFDGMQYCKLLAPSRAIEWIMVDGLLN